MRTVGTGQPSPPRYTLAGPGATLHARAWDVAPGRHRAADDPRHLPPRHARRRRRRRARPAPSACRSTATTGRSPQATGSGSTCRRSTRRRSGPRTSSTGSPWRRRADAADPPERRASSCRAASPRDERRDLAGRRAARRRSVPRMTGRGRAHIIVVGSINVDLVVRPSRAARRGRDRGRRRASRSTAAASRPTRPSRPHGGRVGGVRRRGGRRRVGRGRRGRPGAEGIDVSACRALAEPTGVALIAVDAAGENQIAVASGANAPRRRGTRPSHLSRAAGVLLLGHEVSAVVAAPPRAAAAAAGPSCSTPPPRGRSPTPARRPDAQRLRGLRLTGARPRAAARLVADTARRCYHSRRRRRPPARARRRAARLPAANVEVVDTTGAGDTVNGALAAELAPGRPLPDAAAFALVAAALSTRAAGARGGMPSREEVDARGRPARRRCRRGASRRRGRSRRVRRLVRAAAARRARRDLALPHWPARARRPARGGDLRPARGRPARRAGRDRPRGRRAQRARARRAPAARRLPRREPVLAPADSRPSGWPSELARLRAPLGTSP